MSLLALAYVLIAKRERIIEAVRRPRIVSVFRYVLGCAAVVLLLMSVFPKESPQAAVMMYFILWPLLGLQIVVACLPWQKLVMRYPTVALVLAVVASVYALLIGFVMLGLTGYITPPN